MHHSTSAVDDDLPDWSDPVYKISGHSLPTHAKPSALFTISSLAIALVICYSKTIKPIVQHRTKSHPLLPLVGQQERHPAWKIPTLTTLSASDNRASNMNTKSSSSSSSSKLTLDTWVPLAPERNIICKLFAGNIFRSSPGISSSFSGIINLHQTLNRSTP